MKFKTHIAVLSSYVLFNMQAFALVSGSPFASSKNPSLTGQYAGILVPNIITKATDPTVDRSADFYNALGVFTINSPATGFATGTFKLFTGGAPFSGTIQAVADADNSRIKGVMEATYLQDVFVIAADGTVTTVKNVIFATSTGALDAKTSSSSKRKSSATTTLRLSGSASIDIRDTRTDSYIPAFASGTFIVDGYRQSAVAATTTTTTTTTTN